MRWWGACLMKKRLGKGLDALFSDNKTEDGLNEEEKLNDQVVEIDIEKIKTSDSQPRLVFNNDDLVELAESIKNYGVIQPLVVKKADDGFILIAGERRLRACRMIGLKKVPCIIKDYEKTSEIALIENIQRKDLNPYEEALSYKKLMDEYGYTQEELAKRLGISRPKIANALRILNLGENIIQMIMQGKISEGHAKVLLSVDDAKKREEIAKIVVENNLSVRELEKMIKDNDQPQKTGDVLNNLVLKEIEDNLMKMFGSRVRIVRRKKKGKIEIEFGDDEELERIVSMLIE